MRFIRSYSDKTHSRVSVCLTMSDGTEKNIAFDNTIDQLSNAQLCILFS